MPAAIAEEHIQLVISKLIQELFPLGVVVGKTAQVSQLDAVVGTGNRHCLAGRGGILVGIHRCQQFAGGDIVGVVIGGISACPIVTGQIGQITGRIIKAVFDGNTGNLVGIINDLLSHLISLNFHDLMDIPGQLDFISAGVQNISFLIDHVVAGQITNGERNGQSFAFAGLEQLGLIVSRQFNGRLFDAAGDVRSGEVQLNNILTGHFTGIGDLDFPVDYFILNCKIDGFPCKVGVAQTMAEGILNGLPVACLIACIAGLVVTVANIDALFVVDESHTVHVVILVAAEVFGSGSGTHIISISIHQTAGRIDFTAQDLAQRNATLSAGDAGPDHSFNGIVLVHDAQFGSVTDVDDHDHVLKVLCNGADQLLAVFGQLQCFQRSVGRFHHIVAQHHDGLIGVSLCAGQYLGSQIFVGVNILGLCSEEEGGYQSHDVV